MIKLSKKQISMSLLVLALSIFQSNSFASDQFSRETEGEFNSSSIVIINTEKASIKFEYLFENNFNVEANNTIDILDVDLQDYNKCNYLNTILEGRNIPVNLLITPNSPFLNDGVLSMNGDALPSNLKHLSIKDKVGLVTHIKNNFLSGCENLTYFDSSGLKNVTKIGSYFLSHCENLKSLDSRGLKNVIKIGACFLVNCDSLIFFDTRGLENITHIGFFFLTNCKNLTAFDARGLKNVIHIGNSFLSHCDNLIFFDSRGLENITHIGSWFLSQCKNLTVFDARGLKNVIHIGQNFLLRSNNIKEIITTIAKQAFWGENLPKNIKDLMEQEKTVLFIQNDVQYNDLKERVDFVQENYAKEISGLISRDENYHIKIEINKGFLPLMI